MYQKIPKEKQAKRGPKCTTTLTPDAERKHRNELAAKRRKCAKFNNRYRTIKYIPADPSKIVDIILECCKYNNILRVRRLIQFGLNVNARSLAGWCPVHSALNFKCYTILKLLLEAGADPSIPNANGVTPLMMAKDARYVRLLQKFGAVDESLCFRAKLLELNKPIFNNTKTEQPEEQKPKASQNAHQQALYRLWKIAKLNNIADFKQWLSTAHDIHKPGDRGQTALHIAAYFQRETMIKTLLSLGASPFVVNDAGHTPADFVQHSTRLKNLFERHKQP